jgi:hypothetical protein
MIANTLTYPDIPRIKVGRPVRVITRVAAEEIEKRAVALIHPLMHL